MKMDPVEKDLCSSVVLSDSSTAADLNPRRECVTFLVHTSPLSGRFQCIKPSIYTGWPGFSLLTGKRRSGTFLCRSGSGLNRIHIAT